MATVMLTSIDSPHNVLKDVNYILFGRDSDRIPHTKSLQQPGVVAGYLIPRCP